MGEFAKECLKKNINFNKYFFESSNIKYAENFLKLEGIHKFNNNSFEKTFISLIENWLDDYQTIEVLASGMVGARQGWVEAPYQETPCDLNNIKFISPTINDNRIALKIFSGIWRKIFGMSS